MDAREVIVFIRRMSLVAVGYRWDKGLVDRGRGAVKLCVMAGWYDNSLYAVPTPQRIGHKQTSPTAEVSESKGSLSTGVDSIVNSRGFTAYGH